MARLLPQEAERAYMEGTPASSLIQYDAREHEEDMKDLATGLIGALLRLRLGSLSGPEIGSPLPLVVTNVPGDVLRIFVAPKIRPYGDWYNSRIEGIKKAREFVRLTALSYQGDLINVDTRNFRYLNYLDLGAELQYQHQLLSRLSQ